MGDLQSQYCNNLRPPFPLMDIGDSGFELLNQYPEFNAILLENPSLSNLQSLIGSCNELGLMHQGSVHQQEVQMGSGFSGGSFSNGFLGSNCEELPKVQANSQSSSALKYKNLENLEKDIRGKKRKAGSASESSSEDKSPANRKKGKCGSKSNSSERGGEKPNEVIHVRARRGQATDSHSLAERVRREKINERMRCLQDLVPGCYKTMGMAVMLDEIINYVQSLQHQVEFLSMKLTAASSLFDFSLDTDAIEAPNGTNSWEVPDVERVVREGYGGLTSFH
ncbi:hypothetical protein AMTRI_Chr13g118330 [Amborella trichopoda]